MEKQLGVRIQYLHTKMALCEFSDQRKTGICPDHPKENQMTNMSTDDFQVSDRMI